MASVFSENATSVNKTPPVEETWFKPCVESIESPQAVEEGKDKVIDSIQPKTSAMLCRSTSCVCTATALKGFEFCHKHILEDKSSPFKKCSYTSRLDNVPCANPAPKLGDKRSYCLQHEEEVKRIKNEIRNKNRKKKRKEKALKALEQGTQSKKAAKESSSDEEEYSFFTDSVQVNKTDCLWLGNQASDAESTDSEDENPLNHAGVWTLEECVRICKEKMTRLRYLYSQQFKRLNYTLREERRKMINEYDMDAFVLANVGFDKHSENVLNDYLEDVHLTNYQRVSGVELLAEKQMKEKRSKGVYLHHKRSDLPRCQSIKDGQRCTSRVMPYSHFCYRHIISDTDQYLLSPCTFKPKSGTKCSEPANIFTSTCEKHCDLLPSASEKCWESFETSKKVREGRKRRLETSQKEKDKKEPSHRTRRTSSRKSESSSVNTPTIKEEDTNLAEILSCSPEDIKMDISQKSPSPSRAPDALSCLSAKNSLHTEEHVDICSVQPATKAEAGVDTSIKAMVDTPTPVKDSLYKSIQVKDGVDASILVKDGVDASILVKDGVDTSIPLSKPLSETSVPSNKELQASAADKADLDKPSIVKDVLDASIRNEINEAVDSLSSI